MAGKRQSFARRRKAVGYTQESFAEHLGVERTTITRWEIGATAPQPWIRPKIARALQISIGQLDQLLTETNETDAAQRVQGLDARADHAPLSADLEPTAATTLARLNHDELLRLIGVAGASLATPILPPGVGMDHTSQGPPLASLDQHGALNTQLWRLYDGAQVKASLLPLVRGQLDVLTTRVQQARTETARRQLAGFLAELLQLAGEISFDSNHYIDASHCYTLAATASKEAGNHDMWACSLIRHAFIPLYDRQPNNALPMLEAAARLAERGDRRLPTRQWASTVTAQAHAGLGDFVSCYRALDHAQTVDNLTQPTHTTGWLRFTGSRLAEEQGTCLVQLHQYERAESCLTEALQLRPSERRTGSITTDLAVIGVRLHDTDRLTTYAGQAIASAQHTKSGYVVKKLTGLQPHLDPLMGNQAVREISEHITHLSTTLAMA